MPLTVDFFGEVFSDNQSGSLSPDNQSGSVSGYETEYVSRVNGAFSVALINTSSEDAAYGQLKKLVAQARETNLLVERIPGIGTLAYRIKNNIFFFKGPLVEAISPGSTLAKTEGAMELGQGLAAILPSVDNDIPPLVKHLPRWDQVEDQSEFAISFSGLKEIVPNQPALDSLDFSAGAEAVVAHYGDAKLVVVEFTTPQLATTNDALIQARLQELKGGGEQLPTTYRRVGNYSVFVFDAADAKSAEELVNGIAYEQVVQWLGNNPNILRRAQHLYAATTANIVLSVIKASGLSLVLCLGIGGAFGAFVFRRRRARLAGLETYSDAGGMIRLGIDELNVQTDSAKLIGPRQT